MEHKMYTVKDIQGIFGCGINHAYGIMHMNGFPSIKIGKQYYTPVSEFDKWVHSSLGKEFLL